MQLPKLIPWWWKVGATLAGVTALYAGHRLQVSAAFEKGHAAAVTARDTADLGATIARVQENAVIASLQAKINLDITKAKNEEIAPVIQRIYVDRVRVGPAICDGPAAPTFPQGASGSDAAHPPAGLVRDDVERDLKTLMRDVEQDLATGRACQRFVTDNGLVP